MNPDDITITNLSKSFEYTKIAHEIEECRDVDTLQILAKCFAKLYYKQQETMTAIGLPGIEDK